MSQAEARLSRKIMNDLRAEGYFCFKVHGTTMMMKGLPDIIVCAEGRFFGLETKKPNTRDQDSATVRRQKFVQSLINDAGGCSQEVTSAEEALQVIAKALRSC